MGCTKDQLRRIYGKAFTEEEKVAWPSGPMFEHNKVFHLLEELNTAANSTIPLHCFLRGAEDVHEPMEHHPECGNTDVLQILKILCSCQHVAMALTYFKLDCFGEATSPISSNTKSLKPEALEALESYASEVRKVLEFEPDSSDTSVLAYHAM